MATAHAIPICGSRKPNRIELNSATVATKISDRQLADNDPLIIRGGSCFEFLKLQPTYRVENAVGTTSTISLNANNTATRIIANQQFTGSNIYQLDFTFNNVKLEVPANQGVKGQQYQAAVTWNLVTGP